MRKSRRQYEQYRFGKENIELQKWEDLLTVL
jgi:hypothetical protein